MYPAGLAKINLAFLPYPEAHDDLTYSSSDLICGIHGIWYGGIQKEIRK